MGGRWRKTKKVVVDREYRARRRRSYGLWLKKIKSLPKSKKKEIIRKRQVARDKGFDMGELWDHRNWGMHEFEVGEDENLDIVVQLYAKLGLHRYNMLEGTNLQLHEIEKYNRYGSYMPARYYITLLAEDPATPSSSLVTFQTDLSEKSCNALKHCCAVARIKGTTSTGNMHVFHDDMDNFYDYRDLPEWPSFADDESRFLYELLESDWEENDWIGLYLQVAVATTDRPNHYHNPDLSGLKILNVVVETEENLPKENVLKCFGTVLVYITYDQDLGVDNGGGVCKRRAIVRRTVDLISKCFCLVGRTRSLP
ncbi:UPF0725 protein At1g02770 isoform X2 [Raphanus sativus]|uniref:UPF0725 protein At1g02770 isoform X2 n=1 Tax=Raphanus sativus TaxID=3726 RepID=A0A9W3BTI5_RAPSA|nr:UPF0725 protein At1g02770 isoform X2 [Raphanus sativus]